MLALATTTFVHASATYTVPVPAELTGFAKFDLNDAVLSTVGSKITLSYSLPKELVGDNYGAIVLRGKKRSDSAFTLKGEFGDATCLANAQKTECIVDYDDLVIDRIGAVVAINARTENLRERALLIEVARIFESEPVGVIELKK